MRLLGVIAYVERAVKQNGNENIVGVKIASSNQLKSGTLNVMAATSTKVEALWQSADDWAGRIWPQRQHTTDLDARRAR